MLRFVALATAFGAALISNPSFAQEGRPQPSDRDLLAFYCLPVVDYLDDLMHQLPAAVASTPRNINITQRFDNETTRLAGYVAVRLTAVDATMAAMAIKSGQDDVAFIKDQVGNNPCGNTSTPKTLACAKDQLEQTGVGPRMARCNDLSWLPF
jgi:hypothetical protein